MARRFRHIHIHSRHWTIHVSVQTPVTCRTPVGGGQNSWPYYLSLTGSGALLGLTLQLMKNADRFLHFIVGNNV